jgi:transcriptional regulator GlxA family with amidase domain
MNLFRRELGITLLEYLTQHRLAHALQLLIESDRSLTEVASLSGFGSLKRFGVGFRRAFKETPGAFRRRHRPAQTSRSARPGEVDHCS